MSLPGVLGEIAAVTNEGTALAIALCVGGTRVYIPARAKDRHWLTECVGRAAADKICRHVGGNRGRRVDIPLARGGSYAQLRRSISQRMSELEAQGQSARQIARAVGLTQRSVHARRAARRARRNSRQGDLF